MDFRVLCIFWSLVWASNSIAVFGVKYGCRSLLWVLSLVRVSIGDIFMVFEFDY